MGIPKAEFSDATAVAVTEGAVRVHPFEPAMAHRWDQFVYAHPQASFFHLSGWARALGKTFGFEPHYAYGERGRRLTGIAPFFLIQNWLAGRALVSIPFAVYGGICAEDVESEQALLDHVKELAGARGVEFVEFRNRDGVLMPEAHPNSRYATFTMFLSPDVEANWKRLPKDTRYMIRKAEKAGLRCARGLEQLKTFYFLFAENLRWHGTPVFPLSWLENLVAEFPGQADLLMVYAANQPVAGVFYFVFRDSVLPYYAGAAQAARTYAANNFMYWELMKIAAGSGLLRFDFGRSKTGTGSFAFKTQWNVQVEPLNYHFYLVRRKAVPNFSQTNPRFELAARVWRHVPLPVTMWLGPRVVRWFP